MPDLLWDSLEYVEKGGWIMAPLAACSLILWTLVLERAVYFRSLDKRSDLSLSVAVSALKGIPVPAGVDGLCARLVRSFLGERTADRNLDRKVLEACARKLIAGFDRNLALIAVLASVAPLLGLLGTVIGMVKTFDVISAFGTGNARAMADGISIALITTQAGLIVAVPGLLFSHLLRRRARTLETQLEELEAALGRHL